MWGSKPANGYSDQMYRDRNAGGFETKGKCCCFYLTRSVLSILLTTVIVGAGAASVLAVVFGYSQRWTYCTIRDVRPAFNVRTGWLFLSSNRLADHVKLDVLSKAVYILGIISLIMCGLSALLALWTVLRALCGRVGRGFVCTSIIFSVLLIGTMLAYYIVAALQVYKYSQRVVGVGRFPWPDWAWGVGAGSALLWFIAGGIASVMPSKAKYYESEMEFQRQRNDPNRPYQVPPPQYPPTNAAARGYQNETFVPSSLEQTPSSRAIPPMASQENREGVAPPKKSFMPNWTKKNSNNTEPNLPARQGGNLRDRADEIRDRYRAQDRNGDVELGGASVPPKSAW